MLAAVDSPHAGKGRAGRDGGAEGLGVGVAAVRARGKAPARRGGGPVGVHAGKGEFTAAAMSSTSICAGVIVRTGCLPPRSETYSEVKAAVGKLEGGGRSAGGGMGNEELAWRVHRDPAVNEVKRRDRPVLVRSWLALPHGVASVEGVAAAWRPRPYPCVANTCRSIRAIERRPSMRSV